MSANRQATIGRRWGQFKPSQWGQFRPSFSALSLKRQLEVGSYQTAWAMLGRLRSVLVRPERERLTGEVEVDESYFGGEQPGLAGGRAKGKKVLVGIAVERAEPKGFGRCRMAPLPDASADSLRAFLADSVEPGAKVITDGWQPYRPATDGLYVHERVPGASGLEASKLLPGVHKVASLAKRWLLGTHQGTVDEAHLPGYLNEFVLRFNRRKSRSRGLVFYRVLELAVGHDPVRYRDLIANPRPGTVARRPPGSRGRPPSMERPPAGRPWRSGYKWIPHSCRYRSRDAPGPGRRPVVTRAAAPGRAPDRAGGHARTSVASAREPMAPPRSARRNPGTAAAAARTR